MSPDGSGVARVSERAAWDPAWSPGGDRLAVSLNYRVTTSVAVMGADGSGFIEIVPYDVVYFGYGPAWSPTGERIAFTGFGIEGTDHGLYTIAADGTDRQHVAAVPGVASFVRESYGSTSWSPDGALIAFDAQGDVFTVAPDGSGLRNLTPSPNSGGGEPDFSPDGRSIAYTRDGDIWVIGASGGKPKRLTAGPASDSGPAFSPDGTRIAFARDGDIWVMTLKTHRERNLTPDSTQDDYQPNWLPVH
jgi:TolB protein